MKNSLLITVCLLAAACGTTSPPSGRVAPVDTSVALRATTRGLTAPTRIAGVGNFAKVSSVLYRGEQPTAEGFAELKRLGIRTVVNLRSFHDDGDQLAGLGLKYFHIYAKPWHAEDEDVERFLAIVDDPRNQPVFVHCWQGSDRTGYAVAMYRMVIQGWDVNDATAEMLNFGFHPIWNDIMDYLRRVNLESFRQSQAAHR